MAIDLGLENKTVIITGAVKSRKQGQETKQGIGEATAILLAEQGANLVLVARDENQLADLQKRIEQAGGKAIYFAGDVTDYENYMRRVVEGAISKFNGIYALVNNAGITRDKPALRMKPKDLREVFETNAIAPAIWANYIIRKDEWRKKAKKDGGRVVVNIASIIGFLGNPAQTAYAASKGELILQTKSLAAEYLNDNIRFVSIAPGYTETAMTEALPDKPKQMCTIKPEDISYTIAHVLSPKTGRCYTGQPIIMDAGLSLLTGL
jgi:3-oxoacyl-[acyl-carrier protein] reductase